MHEFGNIDSWTRDKLEKVRRYLDAYLVALKNTSFSLEYIDAFAGTGFVSRPIQFQAQSLFDTEDSVVVKDFIDGSARLAIQTIPAFSRYTFIEKHSERFQQLSKLRDEFPQLAERIYLINEDANSAVQRLCRIDWLGTNRRAVMFLDPYGAQVSWETIEAIAATRAIDLWVLFPLSTVNRLLNRNGKIQNGRKKRLDLLFGQQDWFDKFYTEAQDRLLFDGKDEARFEKRTSFNEISEYFQERLRSSFAEVAPNPLILKNSHNSPLFLLSFAAGNPRGAPIAVKIARHILGNQ
ncbi:MAG: three-Cys-motif partner protein TcmP [Acidobacteria bacterium]|nr:three-Cys-motif partner protein TcmP [Acidobacteriota bacterium]MCW5948335.1 three-Cys-motif partner protein TcmP [Pyrinomonadaceae bacterium]